MKTNNDKDQKQTLIKIKNKLNKNRKKYNSDDICSLWLAMWVNECSGSKVNDVSKLEIGELGIKN
jgi:hypothetical protein